MILCEQTGAGLALRQMIHGNNFSGLEKLLQLTVNLRLRDMFLAADKNPPVGFGQAACGVDDHRLVCDGYQRLGQRVAHVSESLTGTRHRDEIDALGHGSEKN